jgi:hypothetical protein
VSERERERDFQQESLLFFSHCCILALFAAIGPVHPCLASGPDTVSERGVEGSERERRERDKERETEKERRRREEVRDLQQESHCPFS